MNAMAAIIAREGKIRATNLTFIFWDLFYPLGYLLVFGVGINASLGFSTGDVGVSYNAFFLAGVLAMASFGIASNTAWSSPHIRPACPAAFPCRRPARDARSRRRILRHRRSSGRP